MTRNAEIGTIAILLVGALGIAAYANLYAEGWDQVFGSTLAIALLLLAASRLPVDGDRA